MEAPTVNLSRSRGCAAPTTDEKPVILWAAWTPPEEAEAHWRVEARS
jgi:hypothetical protein